MIRVAGPKFLVVGVLSASLIAATPSNANGLNAHRRTETRPGTHEGTLSELAANPASESGSLLALRGGDVRPETPLLSMRTRRGAWPGGGAASSLSLSSRSWTRPLIVAPTVPPGSQLGKAAPRDTEAAQSAQPPVVAVPLPATPTRGPAGTGDGTPAGLSSDWQKLAQCESGNKPANKSNPRYRGWFQIGFSEWGGFGGYKDPADAPPSVQLARAMQIQAARGWEPWYSSSKCSGLR